MDNLDRTQPIPQLNLAKEQVAILQGMMTQTLTQLVEFRFDPNKVTECLLEHAALQGRRLALLDVIGFDRNIFELTAGSASISQDIPADETF